MFMECCCFVFLDPSHLVCEIDEYAELVAELKASGIIQNHRQGLKTLKNTFRGNDFVNWIVSTKQLGKFTHLLLILDKCLGLCQSYW